jgi:hypothetical protein
LEGIIENVLAQDVPSGLEHTDPLIAKGISQIVDCAPGEIVVHNHFCGVMLQ